MGRRDNRMEQRLSTSKHQPPMSAQMRRRVAIAAQRLRQVRAPASTLTHCATSSLLRAALGFRSPLLYRLAVRYADTFIGDNNDDILTNGEFKLLQNVLPLCRVVCDVGANFGEWTALALATNRHLMLHCFEPVKQTFDRLSS